jgi:hypothetical protein
MLRLLLYWFLGALVLLHQERAEALTSCKLHLEGFGTKFGLKSAQLSCSGGTIQASAHPSMLGPFTRSFSGVEWSDAGDCGKFKNECVLTVCGVTSVHFPSAVVRLVNASTNGTSGAAHTALCLGGNISVVFEGAQFQRNQVRPLHTAFSQGARLHIKNTTFTKNSLAVLGPYYRLWGGALLVAGGSAAVESSSFVGNTAEYGGAIGVSNSASLKLVASVAKGNNGEQTLWLGRVQHAPLSSQRRPQGQGILDTSCWGSQHEGAKMLWLCKMGTPYSSKCLKNSYSVRRLSIVEGGANSL